MEMAGLNNYQVLEQLLEYKGRIVIPVNDRILELPKKIRQEEMIAWQAVGSSLKNFYKILNKNPNKIKNQCMQSALQKSYKNWKTRQSVFDADFNVIIGPPSLKDFLYGGNLPWDTRFAGIDPQILTIDITTDTPLYVYNETLLTKLENWIEGEVPEYMKNSSKITIAGHNVDTFEQQAFMTSWALEYLKNLWEYSKIIL